MRIFLGFVAGLLLTSYFGFQLFGVNVVGGFWSSKYECDRAVQEAYKVAFTSKGSEAMKEADSRCDAYIKKAAATAQATDAFITP